MTSFTFASYQFLRSECLSHSISSDSNISYFGSLLYNSSSKTTAICPDSDGVNQHFISQYNISQWKAQLGNRDFSIELWLQPNNNSVTSQTILSFAMPGLQVFDDSCKDSFKIRQQGGSGSKTNFIAHLCNSEEAHLLASPSIDLQYSTTNIGSSQLSIVSTGFWFNGQNTSTTSTFVTRGKSFIPSNWNSLTRLHLYPEEYTKGALYKMTFFSKVFSDSEIQSFYNKGIANSLPVAKNQTMTVLQNGVGSNSISDRSYYEKPIQDTAYDLDDDPIMQSFQAPQSRYGSDGDGVLSILVEQVIKPPVAQSSHYDTIAKKFNNIILLGTDDNGAIVRSIILSQLPVHGELYTMSSSGESSLVTNNYIVNNIAIDQSQQTLSYFFNHTETLSDRSSSSVIQEDCLWFRAIDSGGRKSAIVQTNFTVHTALTITGNSSWITNGTDRSVFKRSLLAVIDQSSKHGSLDIINNTVLRYQGGQKFFNIPTKTWDGKILSLPNETFEYHLATADGATSTITTQRIFVRNVNDPSELSFTYPTNQSYLSIPSFSSNTEATSKASTLVIKTISLKDPDFDVDPIIVSIKSVNNGLLSLNSTTLAEYHNYVLFNSATLCKKIVCVGNGLNNKEMVFETTAGIANKLLQGMTYINTKENIWDNITITVYDGQGGKCLTWESASVHRGCFITNITLQMVIEQHESFRCMLPNAIAQSDQYQHPPRQINSSDKSKRGEHGRPRSRDGKPYEESTSCTSSLYRMICCCCWIWSRKSDRERGEKRSRHHQPQYSDIEGGYQPLPVMTPPRGKKKYNSTPPCTPSPARSIRTVASPPTSSSRHPERRDEPPSRTPNITIVIKSCENSAEIEEVFASDQPSREKSSSLPSSPKKLTTSTTKQSKNQSTPMKEDKPKKDKEKENPPSEPSSQSVLQSQQSSSRHTWSAHRHETGRVFYYNSRTKKSTWKKPPDLL
eukprot:scaffold954_cov173-Ochromonas_danica.AAC.45